MHYRHSFHAGSFADVFKHVLLCGLLDALNRKDTPWFYLETHSGAGDYDLGDEAAARTAEYHDGIARLWEIGDVSPVLAEYLALVRRENPDGQLRRYPGSPQIALSFARAADRLALCEKVPEVAELLKQTLGRETRAAIHLRDGYEALGLLPPREKRGLVLVDPPFERRDEFDAIGEFLRAALARFAHGVYAVWYPVKNRHEVQRFVRRQSRELKRPGLNIVFETGAPAEGQMRGCGMLVVNPPFRLAEAVEPALQVLVRRLSQGPDASYHLEELTPTPGGSA